MDDDDFNDDLILIRTNRTNACTASTLTTMTELSKWKNMSTAHVRMRTCTHQYTHNNFTLCSMVRTMTDYDNGQCLTAVAAATVNMPHGDAVIFHPLLYHSLRHTDYSSYWNMHTYGREHSVIHFATFRASHVSLSLSHTLASTARFKSIFRNFMGEVLLLTIFIPTFPIFFSYIYIFRG